jgi:hypothetical protein
VALTSEFGVPRWFEEYLACAKAPALPRSNGTGLTVTESSARAVENILSYLHCPIHDIPFTYDRSPTTNGAFDLQVHGCCQFSVKVIHEHLKAHLIVR